MRRTSDPLIAFQFVAATIYLVLLNAIGNNKVTNLEKECL